MCPCTSIGYLYLECFNTVYLTLLSLSLLHKHDQPHPSPRSKDVNLRSSITDFTFFLVLIVIFQWLLCLPLTQLSKLSSWTFSDGDSSIVTNHNPSWEPLDWEIWYLHSRVGVNPRKKDEKPTIPRLTSLLATICVWCLRCGLVLGCLVVIGSSPLEDWSTEIPRLTFHSDSGRRWTLRTSINEGQVEGVS